ADLAAAYRRSTLPPRLQAGLKSFLARYGFRSIGEIDIGVERWSENPEHILGALVNYLRLGDDAMAPDAQFAKGQREAEAMIASLLTRVHGPRRVILRVVLGRVRAGGGGGGRACRRERGCGVVPPLRESSPGPRA